MSVNPFDVKTVILGKHAKHVVLIHFPIALFTAAVAFDFLGQWTKSQTSTQFGCERFSSFGGPCCCSDL
jgi:uncharacterized membrane protein